MHSLRLIQEGCIYVFGRDKYYRPIVIMDAERIYRLSKIDKSVVTAENFTESWLFLYNYITKVMHLPGQADMWMNICNLGNLGLTSIPRNTIMAFADVCQQNMMFFLSKSFYLNVSWAQKTIFNGLKSFIAEETRAKIVLTNKNSHEGLMELVHPC